MAQVLSIVVLLTFESKNIREPSDFVTRKMRMMTKQLNINISLLVRRWPYGGHRDFKTSAAVKIFDPNSVISMNCCYVFRLVRCVHLWSIILTRQASKRAQLHSFLLMSKQPKMKFLSGMYSCEYNLLFQFFKYVTATKIHK